MADLITPPHSTTSENFPGKCSSDRASSDALADLENRDVNNLSSALFGGRSSLAKLIPEHREKTQIAEVDKRGWAKEFGYPALAQLIANEQTFFIVRGFDALNARVALCLQDKIVQLEQELDTLDEDNVHPRIGPVNNGTFRDEHDPDRKKLIEEKLRPALIEYNNFVNSYAQLVNRPTVRKEARKELHTWLHRHKPIDDVERAYISMEDDLIAVHPKEKSWFRKLLEWTFVAKLPIFRRQPPSYKYNTKDSGHVAFQNDTGLERCSTFFIAIIGLSMLIGPLWILNKVHNTEQQLGVITGFIALFFVLVAVATNARIFESLAAAAAYSTVLMVFLQMGYNKP